MGLKHLHSVIQNAGGKLESEGLWLKKRWCRSYRLRVRITERELGEELYAC